MVSDLWDKSLLVCKTNFRKKCKIKRCKKKPESVNNLWRILGTKLVFWNQIFTTVFPKLFFVLFFTLNSRMTRNMCKFCHKVCNSQNLPHKRPNLRNNLFLSNFYNFLTHLKPYYQKKSLLMLIFVSHSKLQDV